MTRLVRSELLKVSTTRGVWGFAVAVAAIVAVSAAGQIGTTPSDILEEESSLEDLLAATGVSSLFALLAGIVGFTSEFRHGTATQTFLVTPSRERVLAAKLVAHALVGTCLGVVALAVTLGIALPWLETKGIDLPLAKREHLLLLAGALASSLLWGALGAAVGAAVRNQVVAVVAALVWVLIVENVVGALAGDVAPYLPGRASGAMIGNDFLDDDLSRLGGTLVTLGYVAAASAAAVAALRARDVS